ncbi:MAG: NUDIX domain-containing protein [Erysipelotrichaceae bacterium]|nr:NUDIX domain-containing protein [Erysipelotrichaceae bacterium]
MKYCFECGTKLIMRKPNATDPEAPYCPHCQEFRFPIFSCAISTVIINPSHTKVCFIQQYGRHSNVLVAGYINKGENAIETLIREVKEEVGLNVVEYHFNDTQYFAPTNTLMFNFISVVDSEEFIRNTLEVDHVEWFPIEEARERIRPHSLAKYFLTQALPKIKAL